MAHPLNRPVYDDAKQRVTQGHGILQPRVAVSLPGTNHSRYARLWGGEPGIDPYTRAVSDVYQDVFGEGSFIGKGIYDVDVFDQALGGRFPENRILSHDLIEGCYARSGLLSDVQLYEDYPATYDADVARRHRWIRGDWQIARWALPRVPGPERRALINPLSLLSRWKIADNLRRSLVPAALVLLLLFCWLRLSPAWAWTLAILGTVFVPIFSALSSTCSRSRKMRRHGSTCLKWCAPLAAILSRACLRLPACRTKPSSALTRSFGQAGGCSSRIGISWSGTPPASTSTRAGPVLANLSAPCGLHLLSP